MNGEINHQDLVPMIQILSTLENVMLQRKLALLREEAWDYQLLLRAPVTTTMDSPRNYLERVLLSEENIEGKAWGMIKLQVQATTT